MTVSGRESQGHAVRAAGRSRLVLAAVATAAFVVAMDNTVLNVALPTLQSELGLSVSELEWVATSYILSFSTLLLVGGRLTDLHGRRPMFLLGLVVFVGSSAVAGSANSGDLLISARLVQGGGAALIMPATLAVLATDVDNRGRQLGAGVWTAAVALALALGPVTGGIVAQHWHWRWIFYLNVPVGLAALAVGLRALPTQPAPRATRPPLRSRGGRSKPDLSKPDLSKLDLPGLLTSGAALFAITYALLQGPEHGYTSFLILTMLALAVAAAVLFVLVERVVPDPMVEMSLFRHPVFSGGTVAQVLWGLGINGVFFFTSLFLQDVLGFSPTRAGMAFVPVAVLLVLTVPVAAKLSATAGAHWTVAGGLAVVAVGLVLVSRAGVGSDFLDLLPGLACIGAGSALTTPLTERMLAVTAGGQAGTASAVVSAAREVSGVFGIALTGAILLTRQESALAAGAVPADAFVSGYALALQVAAGLVALGAAVSLVSLHPSALARHLRRLPAPAETTRLRDYAGVDSSRDAELPGAAHRFL
ncbi:MFS transporter [Parafrankia elaeagni]|uniref:MFS transporter n=1 Tax=Parafrankia elaeagni TaxID=222534 RepID=UPI001E2CE891|nr:MFS transporter [Parafrankia elaeagni]